MQDKELIERLRKLRSLLLSVGPHAMDHVYNVDEAVDALSRAQEEKDGAYLERNQCVALIAKMALSLGLKAGTARTAIEGWSEDWHGCVYIDLPAGQVSWHYHDSQAHLFADLPAYDGAWDGHDTPEKYRRVNAYRTQEEIEELRRDAERYRWLRKAREHWDILHRDDEDSYWADLHGNDLDAAIDAAMGAQP